MKKVEYDGNIIYVMPHPLFNTMEENKSNISGMKVSLSDPVYSVNDEGEIYERKINGIFLRNSEVRFTFGNSDGIPFSEKGPGYYDSMSAALFAANQIKLTRIGNARAQIKVLELLIKNLEEKQ